MSKRVHYSFERSHENNLNNYKPTSFYQVCIFIDPDVGKYMFRKYKIDRNNKFKSVKDIYVSKKDFKKFMRKTPQNKYKTYSTYDLTNVQPPTINDIDQARSELLSLHHESYGFAPI